MSPIDHKVPVFVTRNLGLTPGSTVIVDAETSKPPTQEQWRSTLEEALSKVEGLRYELGRVTVARDKALKELAALKAEAEKGEKIVCETCGHDRFGQLTAETRGLWHPRRVLEVTCKRCGLRAQHTPGTVTTEEVVTSSYSTEYVIRWLA